MSQGAGIAKMESYIPRRFVDQSALEQFNNAGAGKYTAGLGQTTMSFVDANEDINSIALTAVASLLEKHDIDPNSIGRLEVGTETVIDKSKSVKTSLMQLFPNNPFIEGVDTINACYGGTAALLNAIHWMESPFWDGRNAIVVAGDIAVYEAGAARPTGGAGCVAMLITPNAPLRFETARASYFEHAYDFYKPLHDSEFPVVDGHLSNDCYIRALDACVQRFGANFAKANQRPFSLDSFDFMAFHSPYSKLVQKSFARFVYLDFLSRPQHYGAASPLHQFASTPLASTYNSRELFAAATTESAAAFKQRVLPALTLSKHTGNSYCGTLYFGLQSILAEIAPEKLAGKRIGMFSYGSGLAATIFSLAAGDVKNVTDRSVVARLKQRTEATPQEFTDALAQRSAMYGTAPFKPKLTHEPFKGTFVLQEIDSLHRRTYRRI
jgi:hydroxymethylglutaryl-CoA synthase